MAAFRITCFHVLIRFIKKTKYTTRCSVKNNLHKIAFFIFALFVFKVVKILSEQISTVRTLVIENVGFFENNYNRLYCVNCRAFHAASLGICCFFNKTY